PGNRHKQQCPSLRLAPPRLSISPCWNPLGRMRYRETRQRRQACSMRRVRQNIQRFERALRLTLCEARGIFVATGGIDGGNGRSELRQSAVLDGEADSSLLGGVAVSQGVDQRQCRLAFGKVITEILAALGRIGAVVEHIVHELVSSPNMFAVGGDRLL